MPIPRKGHAAANGLYLYSVEMSRKTIALWVVRYIDGERDEKESEIKRKKRGEKTLGKERYCEETGSGKSCVRED